MTREYGRPEAGELTRIIPATDEHPAIFSAPGGRLVAGRALRETPVSTTHDARLRGVVACCARDIPIPD